MTGQFDLGRPILALEAHIRPAYDCQHDKGN